MKVWQAIRATYGFVFIFNILSVPLFLSGCFVKSACYNDADCSEGKWCYIEPGAKNGACIHMCESDDDCEDNYLCDEVTGRCNQPECMVDENCNDGFICNDDHRCEAMAELQFRCKEGMVPVERSFCIDIYEASKPDATETSEGQDSSYATSRYNVIPWLVANNAEADAACRAAGKILCTEEQWEMACMGPDETEYAYGDDYNPSICNGIDTFCRCDDDDPCGEVKPCPFEYCYGTCGASFHRTPTGSFEYCTNGYGVYDINGNLWEHVLNGDQTRIRGGAYNCKDSKKLHRCSYIPGNWTPSAPGFRCCHSGWVEQQDAGVDDGESR
jgi:formylglycine-generating enzyme